MPCALAAHLAVLGGILLAPSVGLAQAQHDGHAHAGTPPAPAALGTMRFPVACDPAAQEAFDRGMLLQHSFWFEAAAEAFRAPRQADPGCTMTHWGEALSLLTNP